MRYDVPPQPRQIRLDTTTVCQARCLSCHRFQAPERKGGMSTSQIVDILEAIQRLPQPLEEIVPVNYGEIFLHQQYAAMLELISTMLPHTHIVVPTNGEYMDVDLLAKLPTLQIVNISINAAFPETYEAFMGLKPDFEGLKAKAKKLAILRPDVSIWTSMVADPAYQSDLEKELFLQYWEGVAFPQILSASSANRPAKEVMIPRLRPCRSLFSDMVIGYDGKISSCCFDPAFTLPMGEWEGDVLKSWRHPKLEEIRRLHNEGKRQQIPLCERCTFE